MAKWEERLGTDVVLNVRPTDKVRQVFSLGEGARLDVTQRCSAVGDTVTVTIDNPQADATVTIQDVKRVSGRLVVGEKVKFSDHPGNMHYDIEVDGAVPEALHREDGVAIQALGKDLKITMPAHTYTQICGGSLDKDHVKPREVSPSR